MWVELLTALIVEGYREFLEWWQMRPRWLGGCAAADDSSQSPAGGAAGRRGSIPVRAADLADTACEIVERHGRKHVGIAVGVWRDGETWTSARGRAQADRPQAPDATTIFEIGSVTKVFTALLLADLALEGVVALEDPVQGYLPTGVELHVRGRPITLVDLATQTSGLPRLPKGLVRSSLRRRSNPYAGFGVEQLERAISETRPRRRPGQTLGYSNFGFGVLGYVLALRAGTSYEGLVRERICEPLGLKDTSVSVAPASRLRYADGHNRRGRPVPHWDLPGLPGAGALRSTVADLLVFLELQLTAPPTRLGAAAQATHETRAHRGPLSQGLGWAGLPLRGHPQRMLWHNGGTGGFRSFAGFVKETRAGVVVLANSSRSVDAIGFRLLEAVADLSGVRPEPPARITDDRNDVVTTPRH